ncbi:PREDICTED: cyclin-D2-1-like isoform X3 [Lupinus angustifolius]|uniref:cyclin-D2-1-like isoform X3 n=1 Tax=Lupinus angustifolius TaxID=3871 RepID=UPI00092FB2EE|nr:PREDICTED: cyclin-D2-1-like isoform X3 [Lupinus angustifolius]
MAPSFDCVSSLLCSEDRDSVFDENSSVYEDTCQHLRNHKKHHFGESNMLPLQDDECFATMVEKECQHWPGVVYLNRMYNGDLDFGARKEAVDWIEMGRDWAMQLLAVACLSLAAKIDECDVPMIVDLQFGESKFVFEAKAIQRMELLVLSTLNWRMQSITPFSFIDLFLYKINDDQSQLRSSILQSTQLILSTARGIDFLEFKPSEIAAAVAISVVGETKTIDARKAIFVLIPQAEEERVLKCVKMVHELSLNNGIYKDYSSAIVPCMSQSSIGVLDTSSDYTNADSCANSSHNSSDTKRRKLNNTYGS